MRMNAFCERIDEVKSVGMPEGERLAAVRDFAAGIIW
jgi:hypothetical protein